MIGNRARFINHSITLNTTSWLQEGVEEDNGYTLRDIYPGGEITIDYNVFAAEGVDF